MTPASLLVDVGASIALFLLAAKVHGRQVRLVRELHGYHEVAFMGDNPPWVEELWNVDRRRYWLTFAVAAPILVGATLVARRDDLASPGTWALLFFAVLIWPMTVAFLANGARDLVRLRRELAAPPPGVRPKEEWVRGARTGNAVYWSLATVLVLALPVVLVL